MILMLAPSPSLDATLAVDELVTHGITRPSSVTRVAGGKGLNAARVAHALGGDVRVLTALGGPSGAWIAELLRAEGLPFEAVATRATTRTCTAIVDGSDASSSTDIYEPATELTADEWAALTALVDETCLRRCPSWLGLSGSLPSGAPLETWTDMLARQRDRGIRVAIDSSGAALRETIRAASLVKINLEEAAAILEDSYGDAHSACRALAERYAVDAVVTDGVRGGAALLDGTSVRVPPPRVRGRFSAGSGDAFLGGMLSALDGGAPLLTSLDVAADAAARNALVPGQGVLATGDYSA